MRKRAAASIMVLVGMCIVSPTFAQGMKEKGHGHSEQMMKSGTDRIQARVDELTTDLKLKPEQGAKIKEILTRAHNEAKAILEEARAKVKAIRMKAHEEIKALLNEGQAKKFQQIRQKHETAPKIEE
jgi:DNA-directed RNA polymerase subunit F